MTKENFSTVASMVNAPTAINGVIEEIEQAFDNTLSRDGSSPNQMEANLDMNGNRIVNLPSAETGTEAARYDDVRGMLALVEGTGLDNGSIPIAALVTNPLDASNLNAGIIPDARMPNLTGDVTTSEGAVATTIANNAVTTAKINNLAVTTDKLAAGAVTGAKIANATITSANLVLDIIDGTFIEDNAIDSEHIVAGAVDPVHLSQKLTLGTTVATTSGTVHDFAIPSWATSIRVSLCGVSLSGTSLIMLQLGDSGGIETSGYTGTGMFFTSAGIAGVNFTSGFSLYHSAPLATYLYSGSIVFTLIDSSTNTWAANGNFGLETVVHTIVVAGCKSTSSALTTVRLTTVNGTDTFDAGKVNILYA